jgi:hypothetical protein
MPWRFVGPLTHPTTHPQKTHTHIIIHMICPIAQPQVAQNSSFKGNFVSRQASLPGYSANVRQDVASALKAAQSSFQGIAEYARSATC